MLQPVQLKNVSTRYAKEIAEMREFLSNAGILTGRAAALGEVAARLQRDRTFRRDMTSHLWVVIEDTDRSIRHADLLGVMAIAASGIHFAADADDYGAHDLLRFLMDARRSLEDVPEPESSTPAPVAEIPLNRSQETQPQPLPSRSAPTDRPLRATHAPVPSRSAPPDRPLSPKRVPAPTPHRPQGFRISPAAWAIAAAFLLAAVLAGLGLHSRSSSTASPTPLGADETSTARAFPDSTPISPYSGTAVPYRKPVAPVQRDSRGAVSRPTTPDEHAALEPSPAIAVEPALNAAPIVRMGAPTAAVAPSPAATVPAGSTSAIPAAVLSKRLGARSLPLADENDNTAASLKYPRLFRRRPYAGAPLEDENSLVAENRPADVPLAINRAGTASAAQRRVVRPISLGIMAGNVLYSPAPAYPAAASAAHVEGEVKVEAEVDRDGNVASARVISGPPLLRDAAVDAVQRWRYRPFLSSGKPTSMNAQAIVDFELQ